MVFMVIHLEIQDSNLAVHTKLASSGSGLEYAACRICGKVAHHKLLEENLHDSSEGLNVLELLYVALIFRGYSIAQLVAR
jgi:hypothetical protein